MMEKYTGRKMTYKRKKVVEEWKSSEENTKERPVEKGRNKRKRK